MKRTTKLILTVALALSVGVSGGCSNNATTEKEEAKPVPVTTAKVTTGDISNNTVITGKITANSEVMVIPKTGGKVTKVLVDVGAKVNKGDLLVQIDTTELNAQLKQAQAAVELARANSVQNDYRIQDARQNLQRIENLYKEGAASKQQYETALLQYNLTVNTPANAQVQQAQGNVDFIKAQIDNAAIRSPITGEVSAKSIEVGELAGPSAPVLTIVDTAKVFVEGAITERDISYVSLGQQVKVEIDALGATFNGKITALSPAADARTKGYQVKVEVENSDGKVKPGMFAQIAITTKSKEQAVLVSKEALVARGEKTVVYLVRDGVAKEQEVVTGLEDEKNMEITKGLADGDLVVTLGQHSLSDNTKVQVK